MTKRLQQMLQREKQRRFILEECVVFYRKQKDRYSNLYEVYDRLEKNALEKIDECDISIDFYEREVE